MSTSDTSAGEGAQFPGKVDGQKDQNSQTAQRQDSSMSNRQFGHPNDPRFSQQNNRGQQGVGAQQGQEPGTFSQQAPQEQQPQYQTPQYQQPHQPQAQTPQYHPAHASQAGYPQHPQQYANQGQQAGGGFQHPRSVAGTEPAGFGENTFQARMASQPQVGDPAQAHGHAQTHAPSHVAASESASLDAQQSAFGSDTIHSAEEFFAQAKSAQEGQSAATMFNAAEASAAPGDYGSVGGQQPAARNLEPDPADYAAHGQQYAGFQSADSYVGDPAAQQAYGQASDYGYGSADASDGMYATADNADASFYDNAYDADDYEEEGNGRRNMLLIGVLVGALGLGGALAYAFKFGPLGGGEKLSAGAPPVIASNGAPAKVKPQVAGGKKFENGGKLFYDRLGNDQTVTGANAKPERIVPRQENVVGGTNSAAAPGNNGGPRKVQTLTVLPNGRIVTAQGKPTAATPPSVPNIKATNVKPVTPQAVKPTPGTIPAVGSGFKATATPAQPTQQVAVVQPQPAAQPVKKMVIPSAVRPAAPVAAPALPQSGYVVQVAARREQSAALEAFAALQQKYPSVLGTYKPLIQRADLGAKGIWFRLRIGTMATKEQAADFCQRLKEAGHSGCLVSSL